MIRLKRMTGEPMSRFDASGTSRLHSQGRRVLLMTALGMGLGLPFARMGTVDVAIAQANDPKVARPQAGDRFVFASGEKTGKMITPEDLRLGEPPVTAYPMDPGTGV